MSATGLSVSSVHGVALESVEGIGFILHAPRFGYTDK